MNRIFILFFILFSIVPVSQAQEKYIVEKAIKQIVITGFTRSKTNMTVSSEVSGKILRMNYDVGDRITDKPIVEIDTTFIDFQIKSIRQSLKKLEVAQEKIQSRVSYLEKEYNRIETLHKGDRATEVKRDAAKEELDQAKLEARSLIHEKEALEITLKELLERRQRHTIYAPREWLVIKKFVQAGEVITPNMPLAVVGDFQHLVIPLAVSSEEFSALKKLPVEFDANLENTPVKAKIHLVNPEFDEKTRKLNIELLIMNYQGDTRGGLRFSLPLAIETEGLMIPKAAVVNRYDNPRVTLKQTGQTINVIVLDESKDYLIIAADERLKIGMELNGK